jgi:PAS domain-containing protein
VSATDPYPVLNRVVDLVRDGSRGRLAEFDSAPLAVYVTDAEGVITYFNQACVDFAGRSASVGQDRWCVSWKLFTDDGQFTPHDECPMAVAIKERRELRGLTAMAETPDGARRGFMAYPTPVLDEDGRLIGAVNILIGTEPATAADLRVQARRWRRLALSVDSETAAKLEALSRELENQARRITSAN